MGSADPIVEVGTFSGARVGAVLVYVAGRSAAGIEDRDDLVGVVQISREPIGRHVELRHPVPGHDLCHPE